MTEKILSPEDSHVIMGRTIRVRSVEESDAEFIIALRNLDHAKKFFGETDTDVQKQINYIKNDRKKNYYFIAEDFSHKPIGTVRGTVYDNAIVIGSWIATEEAQTKFGMAAELLLLVYDFCFNKIKKDYIFFFLKKNNKSSVKFHLNMGESIVYEAEDEYYFVLCRHTFENITKKKYGRLLP